MMKSLLKFFGIVAILFASAQFVSGITVKVEKPSDWTTVFVYSWGDAGEVFGGWPGQELTEAEGWYAAVLDETVMAANVIFNNNDTLQTENQYVTSDICFEWTGELNVSNELILAAIPCNGAGITVGFQKPASWTEVYIYGYVNDAPVFGAWPGVMLTETNDWYFYTMDASLTEVNVIYTNNDGEQTADVVVTQDVCYQAQEDLSMLEVECGSSAIGDVFANNNQVAFYPNPANDILNIRFIEDFQQVSINTITGANVLEVNSQAEMSTINISSLKAGVYFISFTLLDGNKVTGKLIKN